MITSPWIPLSPSWLLTLFRPLTPFPVWSLAVHAWLPFVLYSLITHKATLIILFSSPEYLASHGPPTWSSTISPCSWSLQLDFLMTEKATDAESNHESVVASHWTLKQTPMTFRSQILKHTFSPLLGLPGPVQTLKFPLSPRIQLWHRRSKEMGLVDEYISSCIQTNISLIKTISHFCKAVFTSVLLIRW